MACGTPTILAAGSSLPEVGGEAALYFPPGDAGELTAAMALLARDEQERARRSTGGIERASQFTWARTAQQTAAVYRATLG